MKTRREILRGLGAVGLVAAVPAYAGDLVFRFQAPGVRPIRDNSPDSALNIVCGGSHTAALRRDGTVVAVGDNRWGQRNIASWSKVKRIASSPFSRNTLGLRQDNTVVAAGENWDGPLIGFSSWNDIREITGTVYLVLGVRKDGTVAYSGNDRGNWPGLSALSGVKAIAGAAYSAAVLYENGRVQGVGPDTYNFVSAISSWSGIQVIKAGYGHAIGLHADGAVVAGGYDHYGQVAGVANWTGIRAIAAGQYHTVGLRDDGRVVAAGHNSFGQCNVSSLVNIRAIAAGGSQTFALDHNETIWAVGSNSYGQLGDGTTTDRSAPVEATQLMNLLVD